MNINIVFILQTKADVIIIFSNISGIWSKKFYVLIVSGSIYLSGGSNIPEKAY